MTICLWRSCRTTIDSGVGESVGSGPSYDNVSVPFRSGVSSHNHQRDSAFISGESFLGHSTATVTWLRPAGRLLLGPPSRSQAQPSTRQETPQGRRHKGPPQKVSRRKAEKIPPACLRRTLAKPLGWWRVRGISGRPFSAIRPGDGHQLPRGRYFRRVAGEPQNVPRSSIGRSLADTIHRSVANHDGSVSGSQKPVGGVHEGIAQILQCYGSIRSSRHAEREKVCVPHPRRRSHPS